ncbi:MAG: PAS domain-containing protein [Clostridia bacterium]|nr:PAS domain-containing protein [Clostridia bacterium]
MKHMRFEKFPIGVFFASVTAVLVSLTVAAFASSSAFAVWCCVALALVAALFVLFAVIASKRARRTRGEGEMTQSVSMDFLHAFSLPTLLLSEEGQIQWCNEAFGELVGARANSLYGESFNDFLETPLAVNAFSKHDGEGGWFSFVHLTGKRGRKV